MRIKRIMEEGKAVRTMPSEEYSERLRRLVDDVVAAGEARETDGEFELPDNLILPLGVQDHPVKEMAARGAKIVTLNFTVRAAADDSPENPTLVFRATDESEDRHGSIIRFAGWDWSWYMRTGEGVFLYCHDYEFPSIGKTINISKLVQLKAHDFTVRYAIAQWKVENLPNWAELCYRLAKDNFMPQVSVGFIPKNAKPYTPQTLGIFADAGDGIDFLEQEGLELSQVTVGSNRNAYGVKHAIRKGLVSENEVTASGLGRLLFNSADVIELRTLPQQIAALRDPKRRAVAVSELPPSAYVKGKEAPAAPAVEPRAMFGQANPDLPESQREITAMQAVLRDDFEALDIFMAAFKAAAHDSFRMEMAHAMSATMCRIGNMLYNMDWWYSMPQDLGSFILISQEIDTTVDEAAGPIETRSETQNFIARAFAPLKDLQQIEVAASGRRSFKLKNADAIDAKAIRAIVTRVGKVLSKQNFNRLIQAMALIEEVLIDGGYDPTDIEDAEDALEQEAIGDDVVTRDDHEQLLVIQRGLAARKAPHS